MKKNKFYITTPIYYPSGNAHIGHAYCTTMCDVFARYKRLRGFETYFLTGTDEHGQKIADSAKKNGKDVQEYVDGIVSSFQDLWRLMDISNDDFIRTTQDRHIKVVKDVFMKMYNNGDIYLDKYEGWYCTECEAFWTEMQALNGEDHICPDCGRPVHKEVEESYFFNCKKYVDDILSLYEENPKFCFPVSRKNEMVNTFIKPGLQDLSVSRTNVSWGVNLPINEKHTAYVWLDALTNYISALGYASEDDSKFKKFWEDEQCEIIHVIGADISRFHCIYWPMFLKSINLRMPDRVFVHGLIMMKDGKMSKSKGNVISPYPLVERYGVDAVRYYLVREVEFGNNGQFTPEQFVERINMDLANSLGNLLNRSVSMINKYCDGIIPNYENLNALDNDVDNYIKNTINKYEAELDDLKITDAIASVLELVFRGNKYIEESTPWALAKDENKKAELNSVMSHLANVLYVSAILLKPVLTTKSDEILDQLGIPNDKRDYSNVYSIGVTNGYKVNKGEQLFPRLDVAKEVEYVKDLMTAK